MYSLLRFFLGINGFLRNLILGNTPWGSLLLHTLLGLWQHYSACSLFPWATSRGCVCRKWDAVMPITNSRRCQQRAHISIPSTHRLRHLGNRRHPKQALAAEVRSFLTKLMMTKVKRASVISAYYKMEGSPRSVCLSHDVATACASICPSLLHQI